MLIDHSDEALMRLFVNTTRQADLIGPALAEAHRNVGRQLAGTIAQNLLLEDVTINHVAGFSIGVQVKSGSEPIIVAVMRAGLFVAEGIWSTLPGSSFVLYDQGKAIDTMPVVGRSVIIVDSVIDTGRSIREVLNTVMALKPDSVVVAAVVAYRGNLEMLVDDYPGVNFHIARISDRTYIGKGSTDTGARLFGTTTWGCEA